MTEETSVITDLKRSENEEENTSNLSENDGSQAEESNRSALEAEPSDASNINGEDGSRTSLDKIEFIRDAHNRVKLYVLCDQRAWDDRGTGHVACVPMPEHPGSWCIVVRLEANEKNVLESKILLDTIYQKQQGTLIVWSESDTCDLALSFQEKSGCEEIWDKICRVQGKDPYDSANYDDDQEQSDSSTTTGWPSQQLALPPCTLQNLHDIEGILANSMGTQGLREKIATSIMQQTYIPKLCEIFHMCEDLENTENLHTLYSIAKNLFLLNSNALLNELLDSKCFKDIVGMLEYDPSFSEPRKHREFLWEKSHFREVLPIKSDELKAKIHQTYRVQYVQDVCLPAPSLFEENLLTALSSHVFFNRVEIVTMLLGDKDLLKELFRELKDANIMHARQKDLTNFLKEFCSFAQALQPSGPQGRENFFKTLMANDVLGIIEPCITSKLPATRTATVELLTMIVDFNPQIFRDYLIKQARTVPENKNEDLLINKMINHILTDKDPELTSANQMAQVLRLLLDPENISTDTSTFFRDNERKFKLQKTDKSDFLVMFYKRAMYTLCKPIVDNTTGEKPVKDDYYTSNQAGLIIRLLCFCIDHHSYHMRSYVTQHNLLNSVLVLLRSKHHLLALSALRMVRRVVQLKDDIYLRHIRDKRVIDKVVDCFKENGPRYNLLNSALIEFFEFIRTEEIRALVEYTILNHWDTFKDVDYVKTFIQMKTRYDQYENGKTKRESSDEKKPSSPPAIVNEQWKKEREYDNDEVFFNKDDEEDDENWYTSRKENNDEAESPSRRNLPRTDEFDESSRPPVRKPGIEPMFQKRKVVDEDDEVPAVFGGNSITANRVSSQRIVLNIGNKTPPQSPPPASDDHVVTSTVPSNTSTPSSTKEAFDVVVSSTPIILKPGFSGLVDYDTSDSDEEDEQSSSPTKHDTEPTSSSIEDLDSGRAKAVPSSTTTAMEDDDDVSSTSGEPEPIAVKSEQIEAKNDSLRPEMAKLFNGEVGGLKRGRHSSNGSAEYDSEKRMKTDECDLPAESELLLDHLDSPLKRRRMDDERNSNSLKHVSERPTSPAPTF